ncbi:MAG: tRNA uridine-5-carboxymethylaminomethyl(34) synthesis GTPase MnmE [Deltaproteobacteria bacterium]|nr:tRNA uridine-5-carboxymethylaminomethyl(34) synthesis GTPase MnmE [Deltaproteobacteria bacterium]
MSGTEVREILRRITPSEHCPAHVQKPTAILDSAGKIVEKAMVVFHPGPRSYTGEDVAEISCHGNPLLVDTLLEIIGATGLARIAERGEFTKRAYLSGKMDLAQAEAVGALINAQSACGVDMARSLLAGDLSRRIASLGEQIFGIISGIEASFLTDDAPYDEAAFSKTVGAIIREVDSLLAHGDSAPKRYSGIVTTIAGLPNAGKSSLFNAILGYPRAIVHQESGTTRDIIRERFVFSGIDFLFHDTAGIRETASGPEQAGIQKTMDILRQSHLVLYVVDACKGLTEEDEPWLKLGEKTIVVMNKADLLPGPRYGVQGERAWVSAKYRTGIDELMGSISGLFPLGQPGVFLGRHTYLLSRAREYLAHCLAAIDEGMTPDVLVLDLKTARESFQEISGGSAGQDVLESIFSDFCIGK